MARFYACRLVVAIRKIFRCRIGDPNRRGVLIVMLSSFMSARSLNDAAQTSGVPRRLLYGAIDTLKSYTVLQNVRRVGLERLADRLLNLKLLDSSGRSRKCVTLCADDFTRAVRGEMGGLAHACYSGADKALVYGLRVEALIAVIGEGEDVIILDVRVIPPKNMAGRPRSTHTEWLVEALSRLENSLRERGLSLSGSYLSVDSAYAPGWFMNLTQDLGLKTVSELRANIKVWSKFWLAVPAAIYFALFLIGHKDKFQPLGGEPEVNHLRHRVMTKVYGEIVVVLCDLGPEIKRYFTNDLSMKAITVRRVAKRRWQIERIFWNLKQLLGFMTIHQQTRERVLVRVYLAFMTAQAAKDAAKGLKITVDHLHRVIRRDTQSLISEICIASSSVPLSTRGTPLAERLAA